MYFVKTQTETDVSLACQFQKEDVINYQLEMINNNQETAFMQIVQSDQLEFICTGLMPLEQYYMSFGMETKLMKHMMVKIIEAYESCEPYLLEPSRIVFDLEYTYYCPIKDQLKIIYLPLKSHQRLAAQKLAKKMLLELVYQFGDMNQVECRQLVHCLQQKETDIFMLKSFLQQKMKINKPSKEKWRLFKRKKKDRPQTNEETVLIKMDEHPILEHDKRRIPIDKNSYLIGRSESLNDYAIPSALQIGRVHLEIIKENNQHYIVDMDSKNGTFLNDKRIESRKRHQLHSGDVIKLAGEEIVYK